MISSRSFVATSVLAVAIVSNLIVPRTVVAQRDSGGTPHIEARASRATASNRPEVKSLMEDSEALPSEFASDVLLQLVEGGLINDEGSRTRALNRALQKASAAQDDVMRRPIGANVEETPQGLHAIASTVTRLDRISLQARAVRELASASSRQARRAFEAMPAPHLDPARCNQNWYFVPDAYYDALTTVMEAGFSSREITEGQRITYLSSAFQGVQSHIQLMPVLRVLNTAKLTASEMREAVTAYAAVLKNLEGDPLSFYALMYRPESFWEATSTLMASLARNSIDTDPILQALRRYLVNNFNRPTCSEFQGSKDLEGRLPDAIAQFNSKFGPALLKMSLGPIKEEEVRGSGKRSEDDVPPARWQSQTYSQLLESLQRLSPGGTKPPPTNNPSQWSTAAADLLNKVSAWSDADAGEPETEFFHQKAILLEGLAERTLGTSIHSEVRDSFIAFLEQNSYQQVNKIDWFFYAKKLLDANVHLDGANDDLKAFLDSRDPVLNIYARLGLLLGSTKR